MGAFIVILIVLAVVYFAMKGKKDRPEQLGAAKRGMTSGHIQDHTFVSPYAKCPACGASGDGMKGTYDGLRTVKWSCGYCGAQAGIQELKDEELPAMARRRLGLDPDPANAMVPQQGYGQGPQGSGMGGILTGVLLGEMLSGGNHQASSTGGDWGSSSPDTNATQDWGESDASGGGSDWGDSGGGDSGGGSDW
ncbi:MAG TPA: hypothetical protein VL181_05355 [Holophagaceae bacterium]|nr:hypothetical protein [Holophagaceae bacterium]